MQQHRQEYNSDNMESKYHSKKVKTKAGKFDSKLEYYRYLMLAKAEQQGLISDLRRQVEYELIPRQTEQEITEETVQLKTRVKTKVKVVTKVVERSCSYKADFVYVKDGKEIIEDTKGMHTPDYIIKRKLMRYQGHPIREIMKSTDSI